MEGETAGPDADKMSANVDSNGSESGGRRTTAQTAALAVAASAAALAAKRMFAEHSKSAAHRDTESGTPAGDDSVFSTMLVSGWRAAQDTLLPVAEDAAATAGAYLARSGPEVVRERLLPRFISGFERGRKRAGAGDD